MAANLPRRSAKAERHPSSRGGGGIQPNSTAACCHSNPSMHTHNLPCYTNAPMLGKVARAAALTRPSRPSHVASHPKHLQTVPIEDDLGGVVGVDEDRARVLSGLMGCG